MENKLKHPTDMMFYDVLFFLSSLFHSLKLLSLQLLILNIIDTYAAEALAKLVTEENYEKGLIYPPFSDIRTISANIAADVAAKAYELGLCSLSQQLSCFVLVYHNFS